MILLAIHTTGADGSVALARAEHGHAQILSIQTLAAKTFASKMTIALQAALDEAGLRFSDVGSITAASGPGSFTGTRIGLSTAKGLAEGAGLPMVMVSSLALLAMRLPHARAVLDAGRGEFYVGDFARRGQETLWQRWMTREQMLAEQLRTGSSYVTSEEQVAEALCSAGQTVLLGAEPDAATLAEFVAVRGLTDSQTDAWAAADGNYLRRTDAEVKLAASREMR
jgi:tRNA threonylcarbamoyladenosine biosynthesis protein TsaB